MYEDLAATQRAAPLERFVLNSLIPSLLITSFLHADVVWGGLGRAGKPVLWEPIACTFFLSEPPTGVPEIKSEVLVGAAAVLAFATDEGWMEADSGWAPLHRAGKSPPFPDRLLASGSRGQVILEVEVHQDGVIVPSSIRVVSASDPALVPFAREILRRSRLHAAGHQPFWVRVRVRLAVSFG